MFRINIPLTVLLAFFFSKWGVINDNLVEDTMSMLSKLHWYSQEMNEWTDKQTKNHWVILIEFRIKLDSTTLQIHGNEHGKLGS